MLHTQFPVSYVSYMGLICNKTSCFKLSWMQGHAIDFIVHGCDRQYLYFVHKNGKHEIWADFFISQQNWECMNYVMKYCTFC